MKKMIKKHLLELILSSFFVYLLVFLDRYNWSVSSFSLSNMFCWTLYYLAMYVLYFSIICLFKNLIIYLYHWIKKNKENKLLMILILLTIITAIIIRVIMCLKHFTHYDDFGVITTMVDKSVESPWKRMEFFSFWTYAPFQYLLSSGLINPLYKYEHNLFLGRLPSLICGILNILLIFKLATKIKKENKADILLLVVILLGFSWENIIYSSQMSPYSIGITFILLMLDKYIDLVERKTNIYDYVILTLINIIACFSQYQLYIFVFSLYASLFFIKIKQVKKNGWKEIIYLVSSGLITVLSCIPILMVVFDKGLLNNGISWNVGLKHRFKLVYSHSGILGIYDVIVYLIKNLVICIRTFFVYKSSNLFVNLIAILIFIISIVGFLYTNLKKKEWKYTLFFDLVLLIYLVMIISKKLLLSPSRHNMVLIPIILFYFLYGMYVISKKKIWVSKVLTSLFVVAISGIFFFSFKEEYQNRENPINSNYFTDLANQYHPISISSIYWGIFSTNYLNIPGYWDYKTDVRTLAKTQDTRHNVLLIYDIKNKLKQKDLDQLLENMKKFDIPVEYKDSKKYKILYKLERKNITEIEYAYNQFKNYPNSFYCYVIEMEV